MSWQILIAVSVILYSVSVLLQRVVLKDDKSESISFSIIFQIGVAIITAILVFIMQRGVSLPDFSKISWSILAMTALYALANIFIFKALKNTEASRFTVIFSSKTLFASLGASFLFREFLTPIQWIGAILIIVGIVIISLKKYEQKLNRGDLFAFLAAMLFGLANTNDRFLVNFFDPYSYVILGFLLPGLAIALIYPKKLVLLKTYMRSDFLYKMTFLCLLYGLSAITFFAALQQTPNSSQLFSINAFGAIITVVLSILILKEKNHMWKKLLGVIISVAGLVLISG